MVTQAQEPTSISWPGRWARQAYLALAGLIIVAIIGQVFLAGMNVFVGPLWLGMHMQLGHIIGGMVAGLTVLGFLGRFPGRIRWLTVLMLVLFAIQYNHRRIAGLVGLPPLAAIHATNALALFWSATTVLRWARQLMRAERGVS